MQARPHADARPLRILLAEDNPINQKVANLLLNRSGHEVTLAGNGREAVDLHSSGAFDVILMDVQMPLMSGLDATRDRTCDEFGSRSVFRCRHG